MAFSCVLRLKEECDGCGACEDRWNRYEDDPYAYAPFETEYDDER